MLGIRAQFNPSTGNVMCNEATGKVMVVDYTGVHCEYCDWRKTPKFIDLEIKNLISCGCYTNWYEGSREYIDGVDNVNGTFRLTQCSACTWQFIRSGDFGQTKYWSNPDNCTGTVITTITWIGVSYVVQFMSSGREIWITARLFNSIPEGADLIFLAQFFLIWDVAMAYYPGDYLVHNDVLYQCNTIHSGQAPPNQYWDVIEDPYELECLPYNIGQSVRVPTGLVCREYPYPVMINGIATILEV